MIALSVPGPVEETLLREALAPLGTAVETYSAGQKDIPAPVLAIIWLGEGKNAVSPLWNLARRTIAIAPANFVADTINPDILITLPFRPGHITMLARTLLSRAVSDALPAQIAIGPYDFYPRENKVHHKKTNEILRLTDKERDIILTLHGAGGKPVSRQALLDSVWAYAPDVETHTLETHIYRLRQKIEADPTSPEIILTDGQGYKILPV